jgi:hypothetical protein
MPSNGTYGDEGKAVSCLSPTALLFEQVRRTQCKISKIKVATSVIAITPATESAKACLASWWPVNLSVFMANLPFKKVASAQPRTHATPDRHDRSDASIFRKRPGRLPSVAATCKSSME